MSFGKTVRLGLLNNVSTRKCLHLKHSPCGDVLQAECCSGNRRALGAEILRVDEKLKCCLHLDYVVPLSLSSLSTCKEEKGKNVFTRKAFTPSSLFLCWTQAEGEGNLEQRCCVNCLLGERLLPRIRHGEVCNSISPFSSTFQMKTARRGANTNHIKTTLLRYCITSWTGSWKHKVISSLWQSPSEKCFRCAGSNHHPNYLPSSGPAVMRTGPPSPDAQTGQWSEAGEGSWEMLCRHSLSQVPHTKHPGSGHFFSLICHEKNPVSTPSLGQSLAGLEYYKHSRKSTKKFFKSLLSLWNQHSKSHV